MGDLEEGQTVPGQAGSPDIWQLNQRGGGDHLVSVQLLESQQLLSLKSVALESLSE